MIGLQKAPSFSLETEISALVLNYLIKNSNNIKRLAIEPVRIHSLDNNGSPDLVLYSRARALFKRPIGLLAWPLVSLPPLVLNFNNELAYNESQCKWWQMGYRHHKSISMVSRPKFVTAMGTLVGG